MMRIVYILINKKVWAELSSDFGDSAFFDSVCFEIRINLGYNKISK